MESGRLGASTVGMARGLQARETPGNPVGTRVREDCPCPCPCRRAGERDVSGRA